MPIATTLSVVTKTRCTKNITNKRTPMCNWKVMIKRADAVRTRFILHACGVTPLCVRHFVTATMHVALYSLYSYKQPSTTFVDRWRRACSGTRSSHALRSQKIVICISYRTVSVSLWNLTMRCTKADDRTQRQAKIKSSRTRKQTTAQNNNMRSENNSQINSQLTDVARNKTRNIIYDA